jgi:hypothetical protein
VLDLLTSLVEKSLVVYEEDEQGGGRYRLLETVRQYARDRLLESKEGARVRDRHLQLFLQVAEEAQSHYVGPHEVEWIGRLESEHDNLRAALEWSAAQEDPEIGLRLASALAWFWFLHVHRREGVQWLEQLLARGPAPAAVARCRSRQSAAPPPPGAPTVVRARALDAVGLLAMIGGGTADQAQQRLEESLALSRQLGYREGIASALEKLAFFPDDYEQALALAEESVAVARATGDPRALLRSLTWLAHRIDRGRDPERLRAAAAELMEISQALGSVIGMAMAYRALGWVAKDRGDLSHARRCVGEELARIVALKDWVGVYGALRGLADLAGRQGDYGWTGRLLGIQKMLGETTGLGNPEERAEARRRLAAESGAPTEEAFTAACAEGRSMSLQQAIDYALAAEGPT